MYIKALKNARRKHTKMRSVVSLGWQLGRGYQKAPEGLKFLLQSEVFTEKYAYMMVIIS